jgi:SprT-like family
MPVSPMTPSLNPLFDDLNQRFFRGRLPAYRIQFTRFEIPGKKGECDNDRRMIMLSREPKDDPDGLRQWLLHEMCHIGSPGHGRRFQAKLTKLAVAGEAWAETHRQEYAPAPYGSNITRDLMRSINDADDAVLDLPWSSAVLRALADRLSLSPKELLRIAPWAPRRWETCST